MKNCVLPVSSGADLGGGGQYRLCFIHHRLGCHIHKIVTVHVYGYNFGDGLMHQLYLAGADENPTNYNTICKECWPAEKYTIIALNFITIQYRCVYDGDGQHPATHSSTSHKRKTKSC